jgi:hypothetical protein
LEVPVADTDLHRPRPFCDWHEDHCNVLWWRIPISEPPYVGTPLDLGFSVGAQLFDQFGDVLGTVRKDVGGWPFDESDQRHLWWTPLPDAKRIEDQVPL